jgi:hypothetical protein
MSQPWINQIYLKPSSWMAHCLERPFPWVRLKRNGFTWSAGGFNPDEKSLPAVPVHIIVFLFTPYTDTHTNNNRLNDGSKVTPTNNDIHPGS